MPKRYRPHPALKHGGYSGTALLPGEDRVAFEKLHRALIADLVPVGALEDDIVATLARLLWRKQNLVTFRIAELAQDHRDKIQRERFPPNVILDISEATMEPDEREAAYQAAEDKARNELGDAYELVEIGETATIDCLMRDLEVQDRLDSMVDKCLKRVLFMRGLKSISSTSSAPPPERIRGPSKAA
jgi:hypothetical protein